MIEKRNDQRISKEAWFKRTRRGCVQHPGFQWRVNNQGQPALLVQLTQSDVWLQLLNGEAESGRRSLISLLNCDKVRIKQHWRYEALELRFPHVPRTSVHATSATCYCESRVSYHLGTFGWLFCTSVENWGLSIFLRILMQPRFHLLEPLFMKQM